MADAGAAPPLPTQKTRGWEFTDLSELDLDAYAAATGGDPEARSRADGVLNPPEGSDHLVVQVDGATLEGASVDVDGDGRPHEPLVASLESSLERFPAPPRDARRAGAGRRSIRRAQRQRLARRGARLRAAGQTARSSGADRRRPGRRGHGALLPDADRARGGGRGRGLGAVALHRLQPGFPLQHRHRDLGRARRQPPLRHRPGSQRAQPGSSAPSAPRWSATRTSTGWHSASAQLEARSGWRRGWRARARVPA